MESGGALRPQRPPTRTPTPDAAQTEREEQLIPTDFGLAERPNSHGHGDPSRSRHSIPGPQHNVSRCFPLMNSLIIRNYINSIERHHVGGEFIHRLTFLSNVFMGRMAGHCRTILATIACIRP